jgi:hypothetical protein
MSIRTVGLASIVASVGISVFFAVRDQTTDSSAAAYRLVNTADASPSSPDLWGQVGQAMNQFLQNYKAKLEFQDARQEIIANDGLDPKQAHDGVFGLFSPRPRIVTRLER